MRTRFGLLLLGFFTDGLAPRASASPSRSRAHRIDGISFFLFLLLSRRHAAKGTEFFLSEARLRGAPKLRIGMIQGHLDAPDRRMAAAQQKHGASCGSSPRRNAAPWASTVRYDFKELRASAIRRRRHSTAHFISTQVNARASGSKKSRMRLIRVASRRSAASSSASRAASENYSELKYHQSRLPVS